MNLRSCNALQEQQQGEHWPEKFPWQLTVRKRGGGSECHHDRKTKCLKKGEWLCDTSECYFWFCTHLSAGLSFVSVWHPFSKCAFRRVVHIWYTCAHAPELSRAFSHVPGVGRVWPRRLQVTPLWRMGLRVPLCCPAVLLAQTPAGQWEKSVLGFIQDTKIWVVPNSAVVQCQSVSVVKRRYDDGGNAFLVHQLLKLHQMVLLTVLTLLLFKVRIINNQYW